MKKPSTLGAIVWILILSAFTTVTDNDQASYDAYMSGSLHLWERVVAMKKETQHNNPSNQAEFALLLDEYGTINATMKDKDEDTFYKHIDGAVERAENLVEKNYRAADCKAILSALTGFKIAYSPWKGMFLGSKSSSLITSALAEDPNSALVQQLYGNNQNFTPETWGGNKENAIKAYQRAIALYEKNDLTDNWLYLDAHAWLGIVYRQVDKNQEAMATWKKALDIEPDFAWVKFALIPSLDEGK